MIRPSEQGEGLLVHGEDWDFGTLRRINDAVERIAVRELGLDFYPNQIEVITAEQMLDAYRQVRDGLMKRLRERFGALGARGV